MTLLRLVSDTVDSDRLSSSFLPPPPPPPVPFSACWPETNVCVCACKGGSAAAAADLVKQMQGEVIGYLFLLQIEGLNGREKLGNIPSHIMLEGA